MRKLALLGAALLAGSSAANAAPTEYGLSFSGTDVYVEGPDRELVNLFPKDFAGTFTFDPVTNQLLFLDADFTGPGRDFTLGAAALLKAAQPCDLTCFVGALQGGSFTYSYATGGATIRLADPLNGTTSVSSVAFSNRPFFVTGIIRFNGAVPEPGTWLMVLLGFAAVGTALRRRPYATSSLTGSSSK